MQPLLRGQFLIALIAALGAFASVAIPPFASAGPGHDHGPSKSTIVSPTSPRIVAESETFEFVGILKDEALTIYLDRRADTSPVTDAKIELMFDGESRHAEPQPDGSYSFSSPTLGKEGEHEFIITIVHSDTSDLLIGTLQTKKDDHAHGADLPGHDRTVNHNVDSKTIEKTMPEFLLAALRMTRLSPADLERKVSNGAVLAGLGLMLGIVFGGLVRGRTGMTIGLSGLVVVLGCGIAFAGPGHDHSQDHGSKGRETNGDTPRRLGDGSIFLPKPTQRLLEIRTRVLRPQTSRRTRTLIGRVIADPNRSGLVQSTIGGRIRPTEQGLAVLGQTVKSGETLAFVEPAFAPIDASDVRQTAGDLEQRIALVEAKINRQKRLVARNVTSRANLEDLEIELAGLKARRKVLSESRIQTEPLKAPIDGLIAGVNVAAGQVVETAATLFHIVDPSRLWIEAISHDPDLIVEGAGVEAHLTTGEKFRLEFVGRSRELRNQAVRFQFRITTPSDALHIGSPTKVLVETGTPVTGLIVPRAAITQAPNGQMVVFKRRGPESYEPKAVRFESIDVDRVRLTGGLDDGDQVIVRGAALVNQIR